MKLRKIAPLLLAFATTVPALAVNADTIPEAPITISTDNEAIKVRHITDPVEIKNYYEANNMEYSSDVVELIFIEDENLLSDTDNKALRWGNDFYIKNKSSYTAVDHSDLLASYRRPRGLVQLDESVSIGSELNASMSAEAKDFLKLELGCSFSGTKEFSVKWSKTYAYPVQLNVYPNYKYVSGEVWEDDVWNDDYLGDFEAKIAVGDAVSVSRIG